MCQRGTKHDEEHAMERAKEQAGGGTEYVESVLRNRRAKFREQ